jgi:hypothetical protein
MKAFTILATVVCMSASGSAAWSQGGGAGGGAGGSSGAAGSAGGNAAGSASPSTNNNGVPDRTGSAGSRRPSYRVPTTATQDSRQLNSPSGSSFPTTATQNSRQINSPSGSSSANGVGGGIGTAPNGRPIGSAGSGKGSPEEPY